jgi:hypothetical protein
MSETPEDAGTDPQGAEGEETPANDTNELADTVDPTPERTFFGTDYDRFAKTVKQLRADKGDEVADSLASVLVAQFQADSPGFEPARFLSATYDKPPYYGALANHIRTARHQKCAPYNEKSPAMLVGVDAMEQAVGEWLAGQPGFNEELFHANAAHRARTEPAYPRGYGMTSGDDW